IDWQVLDTHGLHDTTLCGLRRLPVTLEQILRRFDEALGARLAAKNRPLHKGAFRQHQQFLGQYFRLPKKRITAKTSEVIAQVGLVLDYDRASGMLHVIEEIDGLHRERYGDERVARARRHGANPGA